MKHTLRPALSQGILLSLLLLGPGCAGGDMLDSEDNENADVASREQELAYDDSRANFTESSNLVDVCFIGGTTAQRATFQKGILATWGSAAALQFAFTGTCGSNDYDRRVPVHISSIYTRGRAEVGYGRRASGSPTRQIELPASFSEDTAIHEMGHVLGLKHEHQREDAVRCSGVAYGGTCDSDSDCPPAKSSCDRDAPNSGSSAGRCIDDYGNKRTLTDLDILTPYDGASVMNYCSVSNAPLSFWDTFGASWLYGPRSGYFRQLVTLYHASREEHGTVADRGSIQHLDNAAYELAYGEGWLFTHRAPGTVPLDLYYSAARQDHILVASSTSRANAVAAGYVFVRTEGYAYPGSGTQHPGTVPLNLYWSNSRTDNLTTAHTSAQSTALAAGYQLVAGGPEAYILEPNDFPYRVMHNLWHGGREDNVYVSVDAGTITAALQAGYVSTGIDGLVIRNELPGTTVLHQYWSESRQEHFTSTGAQPTGYTRVRGEGRLFSTEQPATVAAQLWWHATRADNFTTTDRGSVAQSSGYTTAPVQGYAYPL